MYNTYNHEFLIRLYVCNTIYFMSVLMIVEIAYVYSINNSEIVYRRSIKRDKSRFDLGMFYDFRNRFLAEISSFRRPRRRSRQFRSWYRVRLFASSAGGRRSSLLPTSSFSRSWSASCLFLITSFPLSCSRVFPGNTTSQVCSLMTVRIKSVEISVYIKVYKCYRDCFENSWRFAHVNITLKIWLQNMTHWFL